MHVPTTRLVIIGGGPGGNTCATVAATLGAEVTLVERDVIGRCRPPVGLHPVQGDDRDRRRALRADAARTPWASRRRARSTSTRCKQRISSIESHLREGDRGAARVAGCSAVIGTGRLKDPHAVVVETAEGEERCRRLHRPRDRLTPEDPRLCAGRRRARAHHPRGVSAARDPRARRDHRLGGHRRRVHPHVRLARIEGDPRRVAPAGAPDQGRRGRGGARGRVPRARRGAAQGRAGRRHPPSRATVSSSTARTVATSRAVHAVLAVGSVPNSDGPGARGRRSRRRRARLRPGQPQLPVERAPHLRGRGPLGEAAAVVGGGDAGPQDRRAPHGPAQPPAPPPRLREGRVGDLHRARDRRRGARRGGGVRVAAARSG